MRMLYISTRKIFWREVVNDVATFEGNKGNERVYYLAPLMKLKKPKLKWLEKVWHVREKREAESEREIIAISNIKWRKQQ